ncbi:MAG: hypothetical protein VKQ33_14080 [Candidatus Sericytochromatia bacterium]|nr:hypothetical protein [Candidatus Sericytochromatia bacterium]
MEARRWLLVGGVALAMVMGAGAPADAALVYTIDGRTFEGTLRVEPTGLVLAAEGGKSLIIPYAQVAGVSMDGQPLFPPPRRAEESLLLNSKPLVWALVAANAAAVLTVLVALVRPAAVAAPPGR